MKKSFVMLFALMATMLFCSCKDEKDEPRFPLAVRERLYLSPEKSLVYKPIAFDNLPDFVQGVLNKSKYKVCEFVYSGFLKEERVYLVRTTESILIEGSDGGFLYLEDGTLLGLLSNNELRQKQIDIDNWVCIYFWIRKDL